MPTTRSGKSTSSVMMVMEETMVRSKKRIRRGTASMIPTATIATTTTTALEVTKSNKNNNDDLGFGKEQQQQDNDQQMIVNSSNNNDNDNNNNMVVVEQIEETKNSKKKKSIPKTKKNTKRKPKAKQQSKPPKTPPSTPTNQKSSSSSSIPPKSKTPPSSSRKKRTRIEPGSLSPPKNWQSIYTLVQELRSDKTAPMDYDGGQALPERHRGEKIYRYQVLTALMLSSQTKDAVVGDAIRTLQRYGLDVESIRDVEKETLSTMIGKVGFYNNKTKYMKETAKILIEKYDGDIPPTAKEMMTLPGVGPKMAYIIESIVYNTASGIGVDTHMHRMFNDLKWVTSKTPEQTREQLEGWLPKEKWGELNGLFVGFGQESQQQKEKILKKALACSRPVDALALLKKVGMDIKKESKKYGLQDEIDVLMKGKKTKIDKVEESKET